MSRSVVAVARGWLVAAGLTAALIIWAPGLAVRAADSKLEVAVCGDESTASLTITGPANDSVTDSVPLTISGQARDITQIDVRVDDEYDRTVPMSPTDKGFSFQLMVSAGTHTIELTGNDVCQVANPTASLVITYHPKASPSDGKDTPTETPGAGPSRPPAAPGSIGGPPVESVPSGSPSIIDKLAPIVTDLARSLDFDATAKQGGLIMAMARFAAFSLGVGLLIFGPLLLGSLRRIGLRDQAVASYMSGRLGRFTAADHARRNGWLLRGAGVVLLVLAVAI